jgi:hypothetical protein
MKACYHDILSAIPTKPLWFDEAGVPRYVKFHPRELANIYSCEAALLEIACQLCETKFKVAVNQTTTPRPQTDRSSLADQIAKRTVTYKDPPNIGCCDGGATMTSETLRVIEYWKKDRTVTYEWERHGHLEIHISEPAEPLPPAA